VPNGLALAIQWVLQAPDWRYQWAIGHQHWDAFQGLRTAVEFLVKIERWFKVEHAILLAETSLWRSLHFVQTAAKGHA
jgi:hypothetical protein